MGFSQSMTWFRGLRGLAQGASRICKDSLLGGPWDLVSTVITALIGVIGSYNYSYLIHNPSY